MGVTKIVVVEQVENQKDAVLLKCTRKEISQTDLYNHMNNVEDNYTGTVQYGI